MRSDVRWATSSRSDSSAIEPIQIEIPTSSRWCGLNMKRPKTVPIFGMDHGKWIASLKRVNKTFSHIKHEACAEGGLVVRMLLAH